MEQKYKLSKSPLCKTNNKKINSEQFLNPELNIKKIDNHSIKYSRDN